MQSQIRSRYTALVLSLVFIFTLTPLVSAADSDTVTATVTVQNISVSVSDGSIAFGTIAASGTEDTTTGGVNDSQTATNDGNVTEDLNIRSQNSSNWTLGENAGADTFRLRFCITDCDSSPTWTALTTSNQTLVEDLAAEGTQAFDLEITVPTSSSTSEAETITVTVQASAS